MMIPLLLALLLSAAPSTPLTPDSASAADGKNTAASAVELVGEGTVSTEMNDYNPSFTPDGRIMVFGRSEPEFAHTKIMTSELRGDAWSAASSVSFSDPKYNDSDPTLSPDGRTLYFVSDRPAAGRAAERTDFDIWRVERTADGWGPLEHLGPEVNSEGHEFGPTVSGDSLYFSSSRPGGKGKMEIYRAQLDGKGFKAAEPMAEWNSEASEGDPELSKSGDLVVFWSNRGGKPGVLTLFVSDKRGGAWTTPAPLTTVESNGDARDFTPAFSPDGQWLYFASTRKNYDAKSPILNGEANIYRIRTSSVLKRGN